MTALEPHQTPRATGTRAAARQLETEESPNKLYADIGRLVVNLIGACVQMSGGMRIGPQTVRRVLADFQVKHRIKNPVSIGLIQEVVAHEFDVTPLDLMSNRKDRKVNHPRHLAITLASRLTPLDGSAIGRAFGGRDHSTVSAAIKKMEALAKEDMALSATLADLEQDILAQAEDQP
ncbi:helix-turn-helix domain-containing protein [Azorhizobium caulinodans]|uniref:helix-turn-helix domain-containing protein n=1 Tax=Azorhizobium caulinodans TaxID=7 RepID=UPI002FBE4DDB